MDFLAKYNVIGMAIGLLIAGKVWALVKGIIEDLVHKLEELSWRGVLYGKVLANIIDFLITAVIVFLVIKQLGVEPK